MANIYFYGLLSVLPLTFGAFLGSYFQWKEKYIGTIAAFGGGALIAALTFGLMEEAYILGGLQNAIIGFIAGGVIYILIDLIIIRVGGRGYKRGYESQNRTGWGMVLGAVLDGIPESIALGIVFLTNKAIGLLVLAGIMIANFAEATSSGYDLKKIYKNNWLIWAIWLAISILVFIFYVIGFSYFATANLAQRAFFESFGAGAILAMLATTMMPEAYKEGGAGGSLATIAGFLIIFILSKAGV